MLYEEPELEVILIEEDILTLSVGDEGDGGDVGWGDLLSLQSDDNNNTSY